MSLAGSNFDIWKGEVTNPSASTSEPTYEVKAEGNIIEPIFPAESQVSVRPYFRLGLISGLHKRFKEIFTNLSIIAYHLFIF